jgi:ATP-dependent RNA helicase DeaD
MLFRAAGVEPMWGAAPSVEEIRQRDQERFLADPIFTEPVNEDELALAAQLLAGRTPEQVAAALIRLRRQRLPAAEELFEEPPFRERHGGDSGERHERVPKSDRQNYVRGTEGASWFRLTIGRNQNADPKWLIPLICRLGHVTKKDIGAIKVFERETKFEIIAESAARFAAQVKDAVEKDARIEPAGGPPSADEAPRKPYGKPGGPKRFGKPGGKGGPPLRQRSYGERNGDNASGGDGPPRRLKKRD